jgi:hypothetical protein
MWYCHSSFPCNNGFIGTWSFCILNLVNISADFSFSFSFSTVIPSNQEIVREKASQVMHTDNNGRATFTVEVGPKSDLGIYDTELEVAKDSYQSSFKQIDFRIV